MTNGFRARNAKSLAERLAALIHDVCCKKKDQCTFPLDYADLQAIMEPVIASWELNVRLDEQLQHGLGEKSERVRDLMELGARLTRNRMRT